MFITQICWSKSRLCINCTNERDSFGRHFHLKDDDADHIEVESLRILEVVRFIVLSTIPIRMVVTVEMLLERRLFDQLPKHLRMVFSLVEGIRSVTDTLQKLVKSKSLKVSRLIVHTRPVLTSLSS